MEAADHAIESGTDLLGIILVPNRVRTVETEAAVAISHAAKEKRKQLNRQFQTVEELQKHIDGLHFDSVIDYTTKLSQLVAENGPFLVGVFRNQELSEVFDIAQKVGVDFIQLHGKEIKMDYVDANIAGGSVYGIIGRYVVPQQIQIIESELETFRLQKHLFLPLLDSDAGGDGKTIDWLVVDLLSFGRFVLAGGLTPENLQDAGKVKNVIGYDVSSGVEDAEGNKNSQKVEEFIRIGKENRPEH